MLMSPNTRMTSARLRHAWLRVVPTDRNTQVPGYSPRSISVHIIYGISEVQLQSEPPSELHFVGSEHD